MRDKKRILMTADTLGGVWTYSLELIKTFPPSTFQFYLATMGVPPNKDQLQEASQISHLEIFPSSYKLEWMNDPWEDVEKAGEWLLNLEKNINPDLIHLNNYAHGNLPWKATTLMVGHSCVLSWWAQVKENQSLPSQWKIYEKKVGQGLRSVRAVVGVSRWMLSKLIEYYGPLKKTEVIYNGLDNLAFKRSLKKEKIIFSMGRIWDEAKNLSLLGDIAHSLPWPVFIAGQNFLPNHPQIREIPNVNLLGPLPPPKIKEYLSQTSVFVLPAKYEPFGLSALEAALSGCALILSDISTLKEIWQNSALFFNPKDPKDLQEKIQFLINNPQEREILASKAYLRAQNFSSLQMSTHYQSLYNELISENRSLELNLRRQGKFLARGSNP